MTDADYGGLRKTTAFTLFFVNSLPYYLLSIMADDGMSGLNSLRPCDAYMHR